MSSSNQANRQIARAAGTVMLAFIFSNLVGLIRDVLVYPAFGIQAELDAFNAANRVAELLFNLVAGGALASAFVPTFTGLLTRDRRSDAWRLASGVVNLILIVLIGVSILAAIFAPQLVRHGLYLLAPDQSPVQEALTVSLLRVLLPSVVIFGVSGLAMGILNAHQVFLMPALAPAMYSLGMILGVVFLTPSLGIFGLAWGAVLGSLLHLLAQVPNLIKLKGQYSLTLGLRIPAVRDVVRLMLPRLFGVAIVQLNFIINTIIALSLPVGSVSAITLAFRLMLMPQMAIAQSIAIAAMPTLSAQVARGRLDEMRQSLSASLRGVLLLSLPAALGLILLRQPLIAMLYQHGAFDERSTDLVAWALLWYAAGLVGHALLEILSRAFYALHDTKTPVIVGVVAMSLNVILSLLITAWFARLGLAPHGGLALANSLATGLETFVLLWLISKRLSGLEGKTLLSGLGQSSLAAIAMGLALVTWLAWGPAQTNWQLALGGVIIGAGVYGSGILALGVPEGRALLASARRRLSKARFP